MLYVLKKRDDELNKTCLLYTSTLDFVPQDLNRIYPGGTGPMTAYVCSWYCENIIKKADAVICIHGGGNSEYLEPVVLYCGEESPVAYKSREMAQCFGFKVLWKNTRYAENSGIEDEYAYQTVSYTHLWPLCPCQPAQWKLQQHTRFCNGCVG